MPDGIRTWAERDGFTWSYDFDAEIPKADVVMMLRVQKERMSGGFFPTPREYIAGFGLTPRRLELMRDDALICHPGPMNRGLEISSDAADGARSVILDQVSGGVAVRIAGEGETA